MRPECFDEADDGARAIDNSAVRAIIDNELEQCWQFDSSCSPSHPLVVDAVNACSEFIELERAPNRDSLRSIPGPEQPFGIAANNAEH